MNAFVGVQEVVSAEDLQLILKQFTHKDCCFFLKWPHKVSGFCHQLPAEFPSPEGQLFDRKQELRWKQQKQGYSILLLSTEKLHSGFQPVGEAWKAQEQKASLYPTAETRFPKGINDQGVDVGQRYFLDPQTATVHFVALTLR